jgi:hypothetical protein
VVIDVGHDHVCANPYGRASNSCLAVDISHDSHECWQGAVIYATPVVLVQVENGMGQAFVRIQYMNPDGRVAYGYINRDIVLC